MGVQSAYSDTTGIRHVATPDQLRAVLRCLGTPADTPAEAEQSLRDRTDAGIAWPVNVVAWDGVLPPIDVPASAATHPSAADIELEDGRAISAPVTSTQNENRARVCHVRLAEPLPIGVHVLTLQSGNEPVRINVLSAPKHSYGGNRDNDRTLGLFLPLYALRSQDDHGIGDLDDLNRLCEWAGSLGVRYLGTLPLLASFLDQPFEPSPYAPVSRLFWNELFCDLCAAEELSIAPAARRLIESDAFAAEAAALRSGQLVDYRRAARLTRQVLELLTEAAYASDGARRDLESFIADQPGLGLYARFRAATERRAATWQHWPARMQRGEIRDGDFDERVMRYHLYAQWLVQRQLADLSHSHRDHGCELYLDLPVGVHGGGYDVWTQRDQFAAGLSVGAPPDDFFTGGQNWGFPPLHPIRSRAGGHRYFRAVIANHLRFAGMLRIDHIMSLHRLYLIPDGAAPTDGVYVRYPAEELYAIVSMESHRHRAQIVGENLGTVAREVTRALRRHRILGMSITQFEFTEDPSRAIPPVRRGNLAALNTHDVPTFAAWWTAADIDQRVKLGLLDPEQARDERSDRKRKIRAVLQQLRSKRLVGPDPDTDDILRAVLNVLASGSADVLLVNLEDFWQELSPQNVPGISDYPSWRRRADRSIEQFTSDEALRRRIQDIIKQRRSAENARIR